MHQVVPDVYLLEGLRVSNVYLLTGNDHWTLIDSGLRGDANTITSQLRDAGFPVAKLRAIVLTHAHGDHAGGALELAQRSGASVCAHQAEVPYVERKQMLPAASAWQRGLNWVSDRLVFRGAPCPVARALTEGDAIDALGGLRVIHTPGHTPGSICLFQPERHILFCGDLFFNRHPLTGQKGLRLAIPLVSFDLARVRQSARKVAALPVETLCPGHGKPIVHAARDAMASLLTAKLD